VEVAVPEQEKQPVRDWSELEVRLIVADYFAMLEAELNPRGIWRTQASASTDRSRDSSPMSSRGSSPNCASRARARSGPALREGRQR
jgi:hypothetical protein